MKCWSRWKLGLGVFQQPWERPSSEACPGNSCKKGLYFTSLQRTHRKSLLLPLDLPGSPWKFLSMKQCVVVSSCLVSSASFNLSSIDSLLILVQSNHLLRGPEKAKIIDSRDTSYHEHCSHSDLTPASIMSLPLCSCCCSGLKHV